MFVSLGASAEINKRVNVENLPYNFLVTRGLKLIGDNVVELPPDMINTPDYISAADYVIAKGGWSTIAEIMLQRKNAHYFLEEKTRKMRIPLKHLPKENNAYAYLETNWKILIK